MSELITGRNVVLESLRSDWIRLTRVFVSPSASGSRVDAIGTLAHERDVPLESSLPRDVRDRLKSLDGGASQGVAAELETWRTTSLEELLEVPDGDGPYRLLVMDQVQDPVNAGKLFRASAFFGVDGVVLSDDRTVPLSATVLRTSAGGAARVPVARVTNLRRALETLKDDRFWLVGTVPDGGDSPDAIHRDRHLALVLGSEGSGMRRLTEETCDYRVSLEGRGDFDSLNVAAAGTVLTYVLRPPDPEPEADPES